MIVATVTGRRPRGTLAAIEWALGHLFSFEAAFVLFLYSNEIKLALSLQPPVDETLIFAALTLAAGAVVIYRERIYLPGLSLVCAALVFIVWTCVTALWSPSRIFAPRTVFYLMTFTTMTVMAASLILAGRRERVTRFFALVLIPALLMACYGFWIYFTYGDFRLWAGWKDAGGRVYHAFGFTTANGAAILLAATLFSRFGSVRQAAAGVLFLLCASFLLVAGSRSSFLGVALAGLVGIASRPPTVGRGRLGLPSATVVAAILVVGFAAYVAFMIASGNLTTTLGRFAKLIRQADAPNLVQGANRWDYWAAAYEYWIRAPLFGNGLNSFSIMFKQGRELHGAQPHNFILQILCETGIVGLVLFCTFAWTGLRRAPIRRLRRDPLMVCVLLYLCTALMVPLLGRELSGSRTFFVGLGLLALRPLPAAQRREGTSEEGGDRDVLNAARTRHSPRPRNPSAAAVPAVASSVATIPGGRLIS